MYLTMVYIHSIILNSLVTKPIQANCKFQTLLRNFIQLDLSYAYHIYIHKTMFSVNICYKIWCKFIKWFVIQNMRTEKA